MRSDDATEPSPDATAFATGTRAAYTAGRDAWPDIALSEEAFARHVARLGAADAQARAADLYLACACTHSVAGAAEKLDALCAATVARAAARVRGSASFHDELRQVVRERLLVRGDRELPRIADYAGRASLTSWVGAIALRAALNMQRSPDVARRETLDSRVRLNAVERGPDVAYMREHYKPALEAALRSAVERLDARDRMLLRLHFGERATVDRLALMYQVDRSKAGRWLLAARRALVDATREELCARLKLTDSEFESIVALVRSQIEVSVVKLL